MSSLLRRLLPAAAAWLIGQHSDGKRCDLRQVRCVLPGTRAGRLLLHSLLAQCAEAGLRLLDGAGQPVALQLQGFDHFADPAA